jgi:hypothetical protein
MLVDGKYRHVHQPTGEVFNMELDANRAVILPMRGENVLCPKCDRWIPNASFRENPKHASYCEERQPYEVLSIN